MQPEVSATRSCLNQALTLVLKGPGGAMRRKSVPTGIGARELLQYCRGLKYYRYSGSVFLI